MYGRRPRDRYRRSPPGERYSSFDRSPSPDRRHYGSPGSERETFSSVSRHSTITDDRQPRRPISRMRSSSQAPRWDPITRRFHYPNERPPRRRGNGSPPGEGPLYMIYERRVDHGDDDSTDSGDRASSFDSFEESRRGYGEGGRSGRGQMTERGMEGRGQAAIEDVGGYPLMIEDRGDSHRASRGIQDTRGLPSRTQSVTSTGRPGYDGRRTGAEDSRGYGGGRSNMGGSRASEAGSRHMAGGRAGPYSSAASAAVEAWDDGNFGGRNYGAYGGRVPRRDHGRRYS